MLYNYLKVIIRNLTNDGMYSLIIVLGLAIGIAASMMIAQYIQFEMSFDKQVKNINDVYYTYVQWDYDEGTFDTDCHPAIGPLIKRSIPEAKNTARIAPVGSTMGSEFVIRWKNDKGQSFGREDNLFAADADVFNIFPVNFIKGNSKTALREPNTVVLTSKLALKFFPDKEPLGQLLSIQISDQIFHFTVAGIVENPRSNSSLQFTALFSMETFDNVSGKRPLEEQWTLPLYATFIRLYTKSNAEVIETKINKVAEENLRQLENDFSFKQSIHLHPLSDLHFWQWRNNTGIGSVRLSGDKRAIRFFAIVAVLILIISWANYINLTTARALSRAKEVGLRKVNGANRRQITWQFLMEFLFMNLIGVFLAFTITQLTFKLFASAIGSEAEWIFWRASWFWIAVFLFTIISTIVAGIYPALIMANYKPTKVLKGIFSKSQSGIVIRKVLVMTQLIMTILLLTSMYVISKQFYFMQHKDWGLSANQVLAIRLMDLDTAINRTIALQQWKAKVADEIYIKSTCASFSFPGAWREGSQIFYHLADGEKKTYECQTRIISSNYFETISNKLLYGRDFKDDNDEGSIVINEKFAHDLGFTDASASLGTKIILKRNDREFEVVGVLENNVPTMKLPLARQVFVFRNWEKKSEAGYNYFIVKLATKDTKSAISRLETHWESLFKNTPFDHFFINTYFDSLYKDERHFTSVFIFFGLIGITVTCMGLFGISLYNTNSRTKEIGIRKSLGSSVRSILWLFSKYYFNLVCIAAFIGIPPALWMLTNWLNDYPNRITLHFDVVIIPLLTSLFIAMSTVGYHTYKIAHMNPVKSLRAE